jgi:hypothetical protein
MQTIVLVFGAVAAVLGIYFTDTPPYTHVAAVCVLAAAIVGIVQGVQAANEARFTQQILSNLARSVPPSGWWKDKVDDLVRRTCASRGYRFYKKVFDTSDLRDPEAHAIFLFESTTPGAARPGGILILTPADYAELSLVSMGELDSEIAQLAFGQWATGSPAAITDRVSESAVALYSLPRINQGFPVVSHPFSETAAMVIETGQARITFGGNDLTRLLTMPPIERDLTIAKALESVDPGLTKHLA